MSKVILVVDDSVSLRSLVCATLTAYGYKTIACVDGEKALAELTQGADIDMIVSDINMPNMDGITFITEARKLAKYKFTPIIVLTTDMKTESKAKKAGATAWVQKPFQPSQVLSAVQKLMK